MIGNRLKEIRKVLKENQQDFANNLKIPARTYWDYEKNNTSPDAETLKDVMSILKEMLLKRLNKSLNTDWLLTGQGSMFTDECCSEYESLKREIDCQLPQELEKVIEEYIKTGDEKVKERMIGMMEGLSIATRKDKK